MPQSRVGGMGWRCRCGRELVLLVARVVRSIVHVAGRMVVVGSRQVAVVVSGEGGGWWWESMAQIPTATARWLTP